MRRWAILGWIVLGILAAYAFVLWAQLDWLSRGMLLFFVAFCAAILLGIGFAVAICRGVRRERRERPS
jgi:hypothetical protein